MEIKLNESQLSGINQVLNELPIKEINKELKIIVKNLKREEDIRNKLLE